jgi:hypothetical protein
MSERIEISVGTLAKGEIDRYFDELREPFGWAATAAVREAGDSAKLRLRSEVRRNFRDRMKGGSNFANSFRSYDYPGRKSKYSFSYSPAATVMVSAPWAGVFEDETVIHPDKAQALAIPTETAEELGLDHVRGGPRRLSATEAARQMFGETFVVEHDGKTMVAAKEGDDTLFLFTLRRSVRERKRLHFADSVEWAVGLMDREFSEEFARRAPK